MNMNKIVIVDTGIDIDNPKFKKNKITGISINKSNNSTYCIEDAANIESCINDKIGHGTAIASIILSHNPNAELYVVKIFDSDLFCADEDVLIFALKYILENIDFDIINLSLGLSSINKDGKLESICNQYYANGKVIISAFDNKGALSFPAKYDCVIGVTNDKKCLKSSDYYVVKNGAVNICAMGRRQKIAWKNGTQILGLGNSYACAHFTGILSNFEKPKDLETLMNDIEKNSCGKIILPNSNCRKVFSNPISKYKKVAVFPFNKEIHSLVRFSNELPFELVDVYDLKYSGRVGASTNLLLHEKSAHNYLIKSIENIDWDSFDTMILGHLNELFDILNLSGHQKYLVDKLLLHNKNIYSFDNIIDESIPLKAKKTDSIFVPAIDSNNIAPPPFGKLYRQDKPVLGVFGTSSRQGKFTMQLKIRYELIKRGYKLCQLGTEPSSLLYGMDIVFPYGYHSTVSIQRDDTIAYINEQLYNFSRDSDLIIVGGQSGLVLREEGNISNYDYSGLEFMYATLPDAAIICFNSFDDLEIIDRTKKFVEAIGGSHVIAMVIFPFCYKDDDICQQHLLPMSEELFNCKYKKKFEQLIGVPIYYPNSQNQIERICDDIINYFCCDS